MLTVFDEKFISSWARINDYHHWLKNAHEPSGFNASGAPLMTQNDKDWLITLDDVCTYMIGQVELSPETKKEHVQLFFIAKKPQRLSGIKRIFNIESVHAELAESSSDACRKYCSKEDTRVIGPYEYGIFPESQGKRDDDDGFPPIRERGTDVYGNPTAVPRSRTWWRDVQDNLPCEPVRTAYLTVKQLDGDGTFIVCPISVWNNLCTLAQEVLINEDESEEEESDEDEGEEIVDLTNDGSD